jgi:hypothetical protein
VVITSRCRIYKKGKGIKIGDNETVNVDLADDTLSFDSEEKLKGNYQAGENVQIDDNAISVATATPTDPGVTYKPSGTAPISVTDKNAISVATATTSALGVTYKPSGTTPISVGTTNAISVATATTSALGVVRPDGTSITISGGIISSKSVAPSIKYDGIESYSTDTPNWQWMVTLSYTMYDFAVGTYEGLEYIVAVGRSGRTYYNKEGETFWYQGGVTLGNILYGVAHGNGYFVAVDHVGNVFYTTTGNRWTSCGVVNPSGGLFQIIFDGTKFLTVGAGGRTFYSYTGTSWTEGGKAGTYILYSVVLGSVREEPRYITANDTDCSVYSSTDGFFWTIRGTISGIVLNNTSCCGRYKGKDIFIIGTSTGAYYSDDGGDSWHAGNTDLSEGMGSVKYVIFDGSRFIAVSTNAYIFYSSDGGVNWTYESYNTSTYGGTFVSIFYHKGYLYVGAPNGIWRKAVAEQYIVLDRSYIVDFLYPIGSVMIRYDTVNPHTLPGFQNSVWRQLSAGRYIKTATSSIGSTGGSLVTGNTTLTTTQIPSHNHSMRLDVNNTAELAGWAANSVSKYGATDRSGGYRQATGESCSIGNTGGGGAHNHTIDPTYIQLAFWRRIA